MNQYWNCVDSFCFGKFIGCFSFRYIYIYIYILVYKKSFFVIQFFLPDEYIRVWNILTQKVLKWIYEEVRSVNL